MKNLIKLVVIVFLFFPLPIWAQNRLLPNEISTYYEANNFVVAFSTIRERIEMVQYNSEKDLPDHLISKRCKMIFKKMQELKDKELLFDSKIFVPKGKRSLRSVFAGIIQMENVRYIDDKSIEVKTIIYKLDSETNARLVSSYERDNETVFPMNWNYSATILYREIHKWIKVKNCWLKDPTAISLIEN